MKSNVVSISEGRAQLAKRRQRKRTQYSATRPFHTYYYPDVSRNEGGYTSQGHSATERGAIRGCVVRIFMGEHAMARVYDQDGILIYTVKPSAEGMKVSYGRTP